MERKLTAAGAILSREQLQALEQQLKARQALTVAGMKLRRLERELAESLQKSDSAQSGGN